MSEEAKYVEMARADRSLWLMKCPTVVSRAWQEAAAAAAQGPDAGGANPNPNPVVANVILSLDPLRDDDAPSQIKMEMAQGCSSNTPKSYSLNMHSDFAPMCIFSESNQGKLACEGKVENKFDMKPHRENLMDYGKLCRERTNMSMVKPRKTELFLDDNGRGMRPMPGERLVHPGQKEKKKPPVTKIDMKRTRMDRGELEKKLFKLFEGQPNWSIKQLMQETNQPEFLKEILNTLRVYNKRGPNQGTHELKPEYKKYTGDDPTN
ncbi:general transcription factor IIF subunit 2-like isoform X2 [Panicum virgatum]|uniref:TFIIF beta subunit HTH domain-containing protein n=2 Tax=Panicum virgatum TaxID=38727 RepID=A0A8T0SW31_PANVG|nr:general transcription factor IIF subunit 2-like isoform X2 [Panicum virgatum]KAG2601063.1 hypothetical protein PVAP13_5KG567200 [Panicum virgatum]